MPLNQVPGRLSDLFIPAETGKVNFLAMLLSRPNPNPSRPDTRQGQAIVLAFRNSYLFEVISEQGTGMGRKARIERQTKEPQISLGLDLNGQGQININTGLGFFDHMLTHMAFHGHFDLDLAARGDLHVAPHHTVEDVGICLGQAFSQALGDRGGLQRYGSAWVPMDESLAQVVVNLSNRPLLVVSGPWRPGSVDQFDGQLAEEFWRALALHGGLTLHIRLIYGENDHHMLEAAFKALGLAHGSGHRHGAP
ncbi:Imidazoleglycerol-phosphate dehydratase (modular protein) [Desulfarculales bacterium]